MLGSFSDTMLPLSTVSTTISTTSKGEKRRAPEPTCQHETKRQRLVPAASQRISFLHLPGEVRNQLYSHLRLYYVDIAHPNTSNSYGALLDVHPTIADEFAGFYYSRNVLLLDARVNFHRHGHNVIDTIWNPWLAQLNERHASVIQNLRIATPASTAAIHIPLHDPAKMTVEFKAASRMPNCGHWKADRLKDVFWKQFESFKKQLEGRCLGTKDLEHLVKLVLMTVPFCCNYAAQDTPRGVNMLTGDESFENIPKDRFCSSCLKSMDTASGIEPKCDNSTHSQSDAIDARRSAIEPSRS